MTYFSVDQMTGATRTWDFAGVKWPVSGLTMKQIGLLDAYLKDTVPSPLDEFRYLVRGDGFLPEERAMLFKEFKDRMEPRFATDGTQTGGWPPTFMSALGQQFLLQGAGIGYFLYIILSKHTPDISRDEVESLAVHVDAESLGTLMDRIQAPKHVDPDESVCEDLPEGYVDPKGSRPSNSPR